MNSSDFLELYLSQFFTSLGQLSAMLVSTTVAVPMYSYYMERMNRVKSVSVSSGYEDGSVEDGSVEDGSVEDGSVEDGSVEDGSVEDDRMVDDENQEDNDEN